MLPDEVERLAARHLPGEGKIGIHRLSVGLVNETYRVLRGGATYALRAPGSNPHSLGFDRTWEARVLELAAPRGLAPVVEYCDPHRGILISRWVEGRSWNTDEVREPSSIARVAGLARGIHALSIPVPARLISPAQWIDYYSAAASAGTSVDPATAALRTAASRRLAALAALPAVDPVVCHSDLHALNLIDRGRSLVLLDWEYAHAADPLWDLAGWSANNDFDNEMRHGLLADYVGRPPSRDENLRLQLLGWLYDYVCLLWCDLYSVLHGDAAQGTIAARVKKLNARLIASASGRAD
jgi:thiamine kinase-like enzyme